MTSSQQLFDHRLLALNRRRALKRPKRFFESNFLRNAAAEELKIRLSTIQRQFQLALELDAPDNTTAKILRSSEQVEHYTVGKGYIDALIDQPMDETGIVLSERHNYDLISSLLSLHYSNDLAGVLTKIRQALRPDGLFLATILGPDTLHELRASLLTAESNILDGTSPRVAPLSSIHTIGAAMQQAGFALPVIDQDTLHVHYNEPINLINDLRAMGAGHGLRMNHRMPLKRRVFEHAMSIYKQHFTTSDQRIKATFQMIWLSGWAPHDNQQKPLRPGSAQMSLAAALKNLKI